MKKATLLAILMVFYCNAMAASEEAQRELDEASLERAEIIDRDFQRRLEQMVDSSDMMQRTRAQGQFADVNGENTEYGRPLRLAGVITL